MRIAFFDCSFGAAGDMLVAACLDAGATLEVLEEQLAGLNLPEGSYKLLKHAVNRCFIRSTKFDVQLLSHIHTQEAGSSLIADHAHESDHEHGHTHGHDHSHENDHRNEHGHERRHLHEHSHGRDHSHDHDHGSDGSHSHSHFQAEPERSLSAILALIEKSTLTAEVKALASSIFNRLGLAESKVHGVPLDQIHFHEVGAIDAIVDIVGFSIAYHQLAIEKAYVSALPLGGGTVKTMHGIYPVPGPAVLNLLQEVGAPTRAFDVKYECLTPTGAAILATIAHGWGQHPAFARVNCVGYGAGTIDPQNHPNVVRLIVGDSADSSQSLSSPSNSQAESFASSDATGALYRSEVIAVLETNLDDCSPQILAHAMERLIEEGALDVAIVPQTMKKGRAGHKLSVVAKREDSFRLQELILSETTSLGVRSFFCERIVLERNFQEITLGEGPPVRIKIGRDLNGKIVNFHPEYDDVVVNARSTQRSLKEVLLQSLTLAANKVGELRDKD